MGAFIANDNHLIQLIDKHIPRNVVNWHAKDATWSFFFPRVELRLTFVHGSGHLQSEVLDTYLGINRTGIDPVRREVRDILSSISLHSLFTRHRTFELVVVILQALENVSEFELAHTVSATQQQGLSGKWSLQEGLDWETVLNNPYGLDLSTVDDTASKILEMTPEQICKDIPSEWRIIHIESVMRFDLLGRWYSYQRLLESNAKSESTHFLRHKLPPHSGLQGRVRATITRQEILDDMIRPRLTFHGTRLDNVRSIVRHGFKMPGRLPDSKVVASPRSGIVFDRGIYSSQASFFALSFSWGQARKTPIGDMPSMRLLVCATLMGRTFTASGRDSGAHGPLLRGYDAHFDNTFEYVVHDDRAMLPCYVIHLELGAAEAQKSIKAAQANPIAFLARQEDIKSHPKLSRQSLAPGDRQREKDAKKAAAMKWFPYGFGSATGTNFVIEEIGQVSDDEEEYGDWQADKHAFNMLLRAER